MTDEIIVKDNFRNLNLLTLKRNYLAKKLRRKKQQQDEDNIREEKRVSG